MTITNKHVGLVFALVLATVLFLSWNTAPETSAAGPFVTNIGATATTSQAFSVTTSARIAATTTNPLDTTGTGTFTRIYATICNGNANPVAINLDADKQANAPAGQVTVWIAAAAGYNTCYEIRDYNTYNGSITASSTNQTATTVTIKQYVQ